jgi:hypothetical protein
MLSGPDMPASVDYILINIPSPPPPPPGGEPRRPVRFEVEIQGKFIYGIRKSYLGD